MHSEKTLAAHATSREDTANQLISENVLSGNKQYNDGKDSNSNKKDPLLKTAIPYTKTKELNEK